MARRRYSSRAAAVYAIRSYVDELRGVEEASTMIRSLLPDSVSVVETRTLSEDGLLHPEEAACIERAVAKRRREFGAGRSCARRALAHLGIENFPLLPGPGRAPIWPPGIVGSLSHCDGYCAAAVASRRDLRGLGIDAERLRPLEDALVRRICSPDELQALEAIPDCDRRRGALVIFSAKESTYKCYYPLTGKVLEYADLEVRLCPESDEFEAALTRDALPDAGGARSFTGRFSVDDHHVYTAVMLSAQPAQRRAPLESGTDAGP